jgi:glycosyltransferase involved in cell wall biosynthesis
LRILFVIGQASKGGIETYCLRMCKELAQQGVETEVWVVKRQFDPDFLEQLEGVTSIKWLAPRWMPYPLFFRKMPIPADTDFIYTTGRLALIHAAARAARSKRPIKLVAGVFSQWEYAHDAGGYKSILSHAIISQIGWKNMVFCTEGCRTDHTRFLGDDFSKSLISPLLINLPKVDIGQSKPLRTKLHLVTIANFTPFKTICMQMPSVIRSLLDKGIDIHWTLYGDGIMRPDIEHAIAETNTAANITLAGMLKYDDMNAVLEQSDIYIGSGTTLLEASAAGIPAIVGLDDNPEPTTPGFYCNREGFYTSDVNPDEKLIKIEDILTTFTQMGDAERQDLRERSIIKTQSYNITNAVPEMIRISQFTVSVPLRFSMLSRLRYIQGSIWEAVRYVLTGDFDRVR